MLDFFKVKVIPAIFATLASSYLFTLGIFDALGLDLIPTIYEASIFVFRSTFESFVLLARESFGFDMFAILTIFFAIRQKNNFTKIILIILPSLYLLYRIYVFIYDDRIFHIVMTAIVIMMPIVSVIYMQFKSFFPGEKNHLASIILASMLILLSYFVGSKVLEKNLKFPMIQLHARDQNAWLKIWESGDDLFLIRCSTINKSIQTWRWSNDEYKIRQILVSDGSNYLNNICNRSTE